MNYCDDFYYIERGYTNNLLFFPGWAFDYKIFLRLNIPFNYLFYKKSYLLPNFFLGLHNFIKQNKTNSLSIFAWSMGCFFMVDKIEKIKDIIKIKKIYLICPRDSFNHYELDEKLYDLKRDKVATLKNFYRLTFLGYKHEYRWFRENLENEYLKNFSQDELEMGLTFLKDKKMDLFPFKGIDTHLIFGINDLLVPKNQYPKIEKNLHIKISILNSGHLPFFSKELREIL